MIIKPDVFLLIVISVGVGIFLMGIIIVVSRPPSILSCLNSPKGCCAKLCCRERRKEKTGANKNTIHRCLSGVSVEQKYAVSLVESQPQGQGFYTLGPPIGYYVGDNILACNICHQNQVNYMYTMINRNLTTPATASVSSTSSTSAFADRNLTETPAVLRESSPETQITCMNCNGKGVVNLHLPPVHQKYLDHEVEINKSMDHCIHSYNHSFSEFQTTDNVTEYYEVIV